MKYLCLIYDEKKKMATMSKPESDAFMGEYFAFTEAVQKSGHYVAGDALQPVDSATTVRVRQGKVSTTDGPFCGDQGTTRRLTTSSRARPERLGRVDHARTSFAQALALAHQEPERRLLERRLRECDAVPPRSP